MKEYLSQIGFASLFLVYLFICGSIYLISFWSTFDMDITNYVDVLDIPKSFIYPLATSIGLSVISFFVNALVLAVERLEKDHKGREAIQVPLEQIPSKTLFRKIVTSFDVWVFLILVVCAFFFNRRWQAPYAIASIIGGAYIVAKLIRSRSMMLWVPNSSLRLAFIMLICIIPIFSFLIGKTESIDIWDNKKYLKVTSIVYADTSEENVLSGKPKLLGKLGNVIFLSDSTNTMLQTLRLDQIRSVTYQPITEVVNKKNKNR